MPSPDTTTQHERIGAYDYAIPRPAAQEKRTWTTDWKSAAAWASVTGFAFLFAWVPLHLIRIGSAQAGLTIKIMGLGTMGVCYVAIVLGAMLARKKMHRKFVEAHTSITPEIPRSALLVSCSVCAGGSSVANSPGFLWLDGPYLTFHGEGFDFTMGRAAFKEDYRIRAEVHPWQIRLPDQKGLPWAKLTVRMLKAGREQREQLRALVETWSHRAGGREGTVLPPLRILRTSEPFWPMMRWALVRALFSVAVAGALMLAIHLEAPPDAVPKVGVVVLPVLAAWVPAMLVMAWYAELLTYRSINQQIDKLTKEPA